MVVSPQADGCFKRASFRFETGTVAIYCAAHQQVNNCVISGDTELAKMDDVGEFEVKVSSKAPWDSNIYVPFLSPHPCFLCPES